MMTIGLVGAAAAEVFLVLGCTFAPGNLGYGAALVAVGGIGLVGAFCLVPIQTCLQVLPPPGMRGQVIAMNNVLSFSAMFASGLLYDLGARFDLNPGASMMLVAALLLFCLWRWQPTLDDVELPHDAEGQPSEA